MLFHCGQNEVMKMVKFLNLSLNNTVVGILKMSDMIIRVVIKKNCYRQGCI